MSSSRVLRHSEKIRALPLFDGVSQELVEKLSALFSVQQYRPDSNILEQAKVVTAYRIITKGVVELVRTTETQSFGVLLLSANDLVMPSAATFGERTLVTVRSLTAVKILSIDAPHIHRAIGESSRLSINLMKAMSGQWRMAVRNIIDLNSRTAAQRLGAFLLRLTEFSGAGLTTILPIGKKQLATRLGIVPETLSRNLQIVADNGLYLRGRTIIIRDRDLIEDFCGPDPYENRDERPLSVFAL